MMCAIDIAKMTFYLFVVVVFAAPSAGLPLRCHLLIYSEVSLLYSTDILLRFGRSF